MKQPFRQKARSRTPREDVRLAAGQRLVREGAAVERRWRRVCRGRTDVLGAREAGDWQSEGALRRSSSAGCSARSRMSPV
jgi:hypothetical protein